MAATLGYWDIRGLAHAIRLLLEYTGAPYEDKQYSPTGEGPDYDKSQWTNEKEKLGLDFPNLPYLIDGQTKLTQSNAILRYIARKHKMAGESEEEIQRVDMLENQVMDFRLAFARICYSPDFEKLKPEYLEQLPGKLKLFSQFLGDRKWFAGEKLTYVDFLMYDLLDQHRMFAPKCLDQLKNLKDFLDRFEALEKIAAYMSSGRYMKAPRQHPASGPGCAAGRFSAVHVPGAAASAVQTSAPRLRPPLGVCGAGIWASPRAEQPEPASPQSPIQIKHPWGRVYGFGRCGPFNTPPPNWVVLGSRAPRRADYKAAAAPWSGLPGTCSSWSSRVKHQEKHRTAPHRTMPVVLGYWDIRGLAHSIRLLLEYTGTTYEDKMYSCGEAPDYDKSQWINEKEKLGLDFPNLPYLIDGKIKLTQSNAILRYIARKHKLCGETEEEMLRVDMLENQAMDFRMSLVMICYNPDFEKLKPGYLEQLPGKLKLFSQFLGKRKWFAGEKITFVDFVMYDILDQNRMLEPKCLDQFQNLKDFLDRFEALEKIAAYMSSSRFMKTPINNKMAKWSNQKK
ncbi:uncharacterized protein ACDP82_006166 [Pangshura tecta]